MFRKVCRLLMFAVLAVSVSLLFSCLAEMNVVLYINDLFDVMKNQATTVRTKGTVSIQIPSEDSKDELLKTLPNYFKDIDNVKTITKDMNTFLSFTSTFPLIVAHDDNTFDETEDMLNVVVFKADKAFVVGLDLNKNQLGALNDYIKEQYYQSITIAEMDLSLTINNDSGSDQTITVQSEYLNDKPFPFSQDVTLKKRDDPIIKLSDVLRDSIETSAAIPVFQMKL
jgi:hypothetical protein